MKAAQNLRPQAQAWPNAVERKEISARMLQKHGFVNCIGVIDGTLFPLEFKPSVDGEDYYSRKGIYAMHSLIICDDVARICRAVIGWAGSCHDNRVWSQCDVHNNQQQFFSPTEYILGDSAFRASAILVPSFKKSARGEMSHHEELFNTKLSKARIKVEHCIGLLKARWQYLKTIRIQIRDKASSRQAIRHVICAMVLHNLLIFEPIPDEWVPQMEAIILDEDDELNLPATPQGTLRREQLQIGYGNLSGNSCNSSNLSSRRLIIALKQLIWIIRVQASTEQSTRGSFSSAPRVVTPHVHFFTLH